MEDNLAKIILEENQRNYNLFAKDFALRRQKPWPEIESLILKYFKENNKVLDLGCGSGQYSQIFKDKNAFYFGVDFSEKLIEIAKNQYLNTTINNKIQFIFANAFSLPFEDNFFDLVFSIATLHHIPSQKLRKEFIKEIKRVLKKDGILIITVWNLFNKKNYFKILKANFLKLLRLSKLDFNDIILPLGPIPKVYFHCFRKKEVEDLLVKNQFQILESGYLNRKNKEKSNIFIVGRKIQ
jgi:ubiquinone/menaquinone biosynthesis C-methylase UbiE